LDAGRRGLALSAWCVVAAFGTYFCMYAFRKPFTAEEYSGLSFWGLDYKPLLVISQALGYTLSKFVGIKVNSEATPARRVGLLLALIGAAEAALVLFALTPMPYNYVWLFANGLMLGMVFGLVLAAIEGRRHTEALAAGLCASFIVADGVCKTTGRYLLAAHVPPLWMPAAAGLLFTRPLLIFAWMLSYVPPPTSEDAEARGERMPMDAGHRWRFFRRHAAVLTLLVSMFLLVTVLRSVRSDFAPEIWGGLQENTEPDAFTWSEMAVGAGVLLAAGATVLIRDNARAFSVALALAATGAALVAVSMLLLQAGLLSPLAFMSLHGLGLYLPYIAVHTTLLERLVAMTRERGNIAYLMALADSFGYLGYVAVLLARVWAGRGMAEFLPFFLALSWAIAGACLALLAACWIWFTLRPPAPALESA
jgi:hypothetical protein